MNRIAATATLVMLLTATVVSTASGSEDAETELPSYFFDWDEVAAADAPPVVTLAPGPDGTCSGRIQSHIEIGPEEAGMKRLSMAPLPGRTCVYEVHATAGDETETTLYDAQVEAAMLVSEVTCTINVDGCLHEAKNPPAVHVPTPGPGSQDVEATWCRLGDGWAHTGYPDPPTVVYTRVYQDIKLCWTSTEAWIEELSGVCFANPTSDWVTDADECYFSDWNTGPASKVFLTIHGWFEKTTGSPPFRPAHEMWNTINGDAGTGAVYCDGDIVGDYDGYVTVDNCGATAPERQE